MEMVYQYLTGPRFRHRIDAIVEKFTDMQNDLDRERQDHDADVGQARGVARRGARLNRRPQSRCSTP
jgi:hypothetical protein